MSENERTLVRFVEDNPNNSLPKLPEGGSEFYPRAMRVGKNSKLFGVPKVFRIQRRKLINGGVTHFSPGSEIIVETRGSYENQAIIVGLYSLNGDSLYNFLG